MIKGYIHITIEQFIPNELEMKNVRNSRNVIEKAINGVDKPSTSGENSTVIIVNIRPKKYFEKYPKQHGNGVRISKKEGICYLRLGIDKGEIDEANITAKELVHLLQKELIEEESLKSTKVKQEICNSVLLKLQNIEW